MQIECLKDTLLEKIILLQGATSKNTTLPILNNILIQTENGRVKLTATNLEIGIIAWVGSKITEQGEVSIPIKLLINVLSNISSEKVILKSEKNSLIIEGGVSKAVIKGMSSKDFPIVPKIEGGIEFSLNYEFLKNALSKTLFAVSLNDARPELTGIFLEFDKEERKLNFVSTDSFRLARAQFKFLSGAPAENFGVIVPSKTLSEVLKSISKSEGSAEIRISDNQILFNLSNNIFIISRIIEGQYPPYSQIIPAKNEIEISFNKEDLIKAVKMAGIFASGKALEIAFKQKGENKIEIHSSCQEIGENISVLESEIHGNMANNLTFSYKYLLEGISALDSKKACFLINNSNTPAVIKSEKSDDYFLYLMMPIN